MWEVGGEKLLASVCLLSSQLRILGKDFAEELGSTAFRSIELDVMYVV